MYLNIFNQPQHPEEDIHILMKAKVKIFLIGEGHCTEED